MLYESPKILLNVGMGDYGRVRQAECDCQFGQLGFDTHVSDIRSYEKLTGEGVTFVDMDFVRILEKELPMLSGDRVPTIRWLKRKMSEASRGCN